MSERFDIQIADENGEMVPLTLARDARGQIMYTETNPDFLRQSVALGEVTYASADPRSQGVLAQDDLSRGIGHRNQAPMANADFRRLRYGQYADYGPYEMGNGPATTTISKLTNMGSLTGAFELGGSLYLIGSRIIAAYDASAGTISEAEDLGSGVTGYGGATWFQTASETNDQANTGDTATDTITTASGRIAQKVMPGQTGYLSKVDVKLIRVGTIAGDVRLAVQADYNGQPSGSDLSSSNKLAADISTSATVYTFRFDDDDAYFMSKNEPFWLVLDCASATASVTMGWRRDSTNPGGYTSGTGATSADSGHTWTNNTNSTDYYFTTYYKAVTETAFVGKDAGAKFLTTTDGATFTADSTYEGKHFCVYNDLLVRDCRASSAGAITWSTDGKNWSEPLPVGNPGIQVTALLALPQSILVVTQEAIYAVDPDSDPVSIDIVASAARSTTNGVGATVWRGTAFVPFGGTLAAISGNFTDGFTFYPSIGPESVEGWEAPWGAGRIVAVAHDRFCLYAALSTSTSYVLLKSYSPLEKAWIGHIADLGTPTTFTFMHVFDRGGTNSPLLFFSTDSDNLGRITLPRALRPWSDTSYSVNTTNPAQFFWSRATGLMPANPKAWLVETLTFGQTASGGFAETLYDTGDGQSWRALDNGKLYDTGAVPYPGELSSLLMDRQTRLTAGSATSYPLLVVSALTFAVRPNQNLREHRFTVDDGAGSYSSRTLGDLLGVRPERVMAVMSGLPVAGGTRRTLDPDRAEHWITYRTVTKVMVERSEEGHRYFDVVGVSQA